MKKLLNVAAIAIAACGLLLTSCASGGAKGSDGPSIPHPRSYVIDPADGATTLDMAYNQYGPNYQGTVDMWGFMKKDKPQAGDTVAIKAKVTSDIDIPNVVFYLTDNSPAANYWTNLTDDNYMLDMKAGVPVDIDVEVVLNTSSKGGLIVVFAYDGSDHGQEDAPKVNAPAKFTFEKVADTTDTTAEVPSTPHVSAREIDLGKYAAFLQIETNHPWIDGAQDMSVIANYQAVPEITGLYGEDLPKAGDTLKVTWTATSDVDISKVYIRPVDNSSAANWWKELINPIWGVELEDGTKDLTEQDAQMLFGENIVAGEPFTLEKEIKFEADAVAQVALCIWYEVDAGDGPAICKIVR